MKKDYINEMTLDIMEYIRENDIVIDEENEDEIKEQLYDDLFINDSVTGNASGSYYFNSWESKEKVLNNLDLLKEACAEFGCNDILGEKFVDEEWEWMDVTIRCYLLSEAIEKALVLYEFE